MYIRGVILFLMDHLFYEEITPEVFLVREEEPMYNKKRYRTSGVFSIRYLTSCAQYQAVIKTQRRLTAESVRSPSVLFIQHK